MPIVANDAMAVGAIDALCAAGYCIPNDVAIVGYDNLKFTQLLRLVALFFSAQPYFVEGIVLSGLKG